LSTICVWRKTAPLWTASRLMVRAILSSCCSFFSSAEMAKVGIVDLVRVLTS
jgi:hypothetical protein